MAPSEAEIEEGLDVADVQFNDHLHDKQEDNQFHEPRPIDELGLCMMV